MLQCSPMSPERVRARAEWAASSQTPQNPTPVCRHSAAPSSGDRRSLTRRVGRLCDHHLRPGPPDTIHRGAVGLAAHLDVVPHPRLQLPENHPRVGLHQPLKRADKDVERGEEPHVLAGEHADVPHPTDPTALRGDCTRGGCIPEEQRGVLQHPEPEGSWREGIRAWQRSLGVTAPSHIPAGSTCCTSSRSGVWRLPPPHPRNT